MALYYLQSATTGNTTRTFRGKQQAHDHGAAIAFSKTIRSLWVRSFGVEPELGAFQSNQSNPVADYTLRYDRGSRDWYQ